MSYNGQILTRTCLVEQVTDHFGADLLVLSGEGVANILVFKSQASKQLRIMDEDKDDIDLKHISKEIIHGANQNKSSKDTYYLSVTQESTADNTSPLLMRLLSLLSPKLANTNTANMIGNMVTAAITNRYTMLQVALGILIQREPTS